MKNKIYIFLFLIIGFFILTGIFSNSSAFSVEYEDNTYNFGDIDNNLYSYCIVYYYNYSFAQYPFLRLYSCDQYPIVVSNNEIIFIGNVRVYTYNLKNGSVYDHYNGYQDPNSSSFSNWTRPHKYNAQPVVWSNFDIKDSEGNILVNKSGFLEVTSKLELNLTIEPTDKTDKVPVLISTQWYVYSDIGLGLFVNADNQAYDFNFYLPDVDKVVTYDDKLGRTECKYDSSGRLLYRYVYKCYRNGTYKFKLVNTRDLINNDDINKPPTDYYVEETINIDNIVVNEDTINNYINGSFCPTPFLSYEYVSDSEINIVTQKFFINELIDLQCYWIKEVEGQTIDFKSNEGWTKIENPRSFKDALTEEEVFQFYFSIKNDEFDANGRYWVKFYNIFLDKYTWSYIDIDFNEILKVDGSLLFKYVNFFRERFGFLVYPFDLAVDVLNKMKNIKFEEPAFNIPNIEEPFTHQKLISATYFSFNDLLKNEVMKNIHDIYFIVVDAIIIFSLINLLKKKIMGVFDK